MYGYMGFWSSILAFGFSFWLCCGWGSCWSVFVFVLAFAFTFSFVVFAFALTFVVFAFSPLAFAFAFIVFSFLRSFERVFAWRALRVVLLLVDVGVEELAIVSKLAPLSFGRIEVTLLLMPIGT